MINKLTKSALLLLLLSMSQGAMATDELFREQLLRIINQLNAIKPVIGEAERYQVQNTAVKLHLKAFEGADGGLHNGVQEDIELIKKGLIAYLNRPVIAPKKVLPIAGDFIETPKKESFKKRENS